MFVFGHLGIGGGLVYLVRREWPLAGVLFGTLLPDLIDKPLYYGLVQTDVLPSYVRLLVPGTRTIGHTLAAALLLLMPAFIRVPSRAIWPAISVGLVTHIFLDIASDVALCWHARVPFTTQGSGAWRAAFFPFFGEFTPATRTPNFLEHAWANFVSHLPSEALGAAILAGIAWHLRARSRPRDAHAIDAGQLSRSGAGN